MSGNYRFALHTRRKERGVTIIVVAFTLIAFLALAALSIDVAQLYVARGEAQRAADAAALAGAKIFVASAYTSVQGSGLPVADSTTVCNAAQALAQTAAQKNSIAGVSATVDSINCDATTKPENPTVTVTVSRSAVPTFFARIWGRLGTTARATAIAEAYNPSTSDAPIQVAVKPWLVPNCDPSGGAGTCNDHYFIDASGNIVSHTPPLVGKTIQLNLITTGHAVATGTGGNTLDFYPLNIPTTSPTTPICPSCAGGNSYRDNIACTSQFLVSCGQPISQAESIKVQTGFGLTNSTKTAARCLIHNPTLSDGLGFGQDIVSAGTPPTIQGGDENPNPSLRGVNNISRSDSIVTVPLYQENTPNTPLCNGGFCGGSTTVIGFLQLAITQTSTAAGSQVQGVIMNVSGCTPASIAAYTPGQGVTGSGTSPVPVRLIHN